MMRPTISTYNIPEYDLGAVAMRLLTKMLVDDESVKQNKDIEISFSKMFRETTKGAINLDGVRWICSPRF